MMYFKSTMSSKSSQSSTKGSWEAWEADHLPQLFSELRSPYQQDSRRGWKLTQAVLCIDTPGAWIYPNASMQKQAGLSAALSSGSCCACSATPVLGPLLAHSHPITIPCRLLVSERPLAWMQFASLHHVSRSRSCGKIWYVSLLTSYYSWQKSKWTTVV